jgi:hypothetical protein
MTTSAFTPAVHQNDHAAAAAYLMKHSGATALSPADMPGDDGAPLPGRARARLRRHSGPENRPPSGSQNGQAG